MPYCSLELVHMLLQRHQLCFFLSGNWKHNQMSNHSKPHLHILHVFHHPSTIEPLNVNQLAGTTCSQFSNYLSCIIGSNQVFSGLHQVLPSLEQAQTAPRHNKVFELFVKNYVYVLCCKNDGPRPEVFVWVCLERAGEKPEWMCGPCSHQLPGWTPCFHSDNNN